MASMGSMGMNPMGSRMPPVSSSNPMMNPQMMRPNGPAMNPSEHEHRSKVLGSYPELAKFYW